MKAAYLSSRNIDQINWLVGLVRKKQIHKEKDRLRALLLIRIAGGFSLTKSTASAQVRHSDHVSDSN